MRVRRAVTLLLITLVVPGSAQVAAGDRRLGRAALKVWLGLVGVGVLLALLALVNRGAIVGLLTRPFVLSVAAIVAFLIALAMPLLVFDAWRLGRPRLLPARPRRWIAALTALLMLLTFAVPVMVGRRAWAAGDLISSVFGSGTQSDAVDGRYTVLLLGGDAGADRVGLRPDSVTLASIDADNGRTVLFSLPRNLENIPFPEGSDGAKALPDGWSCGDECLLNGIYTWATDHPDYFPGADDPGAEAMKQAVEGVLGVPVNYYVMVDLKGFAQIINAMGGIDLNVKTRVPIGGVGSRISGYIEPGEQHLDGYHALWYARSRSGSNDYERMARQRCVMTAMVNQLDPSTLLSRFQGIAAAGKQVVKTDLPSSELATFIELGLKAKAQKITSVQFVPPLIRPAHPDYTLIHDRVASAIEASEDAKDEAPPAAAASGESGTSGSGSTSGSAGTSGGSDAQPSAAATTGEGTDIRSVCSAG